MNGKHTEWGPVDGQLSRAARKHRLVRDVIHFAVVVALMALFFGAIALAPAEARQRFSQRQVSGCANGQCAIKQQAVVVQKVVAQPVVHHAAQVVHAAPVVAQVAYQQPVYPPVQNFFYSVGQPLVQEAQMTAAVKNALAEHQFKATVNATINGSVSGAAQQFYQQQPAPQWQPPPQPQQPWQPPAEPQPEERPTFSQTGHGALQEHCATCHANGKAKGGFSLDSMSGEQFWAAVDRVRDGTMPPASPLAAAARESVVKELLTRQP